MTIYGISGLGADSRVFNHLKLDSELIPIDWIDPEKNETIEAYAKRLAKIINANESFALLGVSFGGLIAVEISKLLKPNLTILISSVETRDELRTFFRVTGKINILRLMPKIFFDPPRRLAHWVFSTKKKELLNQILDDTDLNFAKWAIIELLSWKNQEKVKNRIVKIGGTKDRLMPANKKDNRLIDGGGHFMIIDRADEISKIINEELAHNAEL